MWLVLGPVALVVLVLSLKWRPAEPVQEGALPGTETPLPVGADDRKPFRGLQP